MIHRSYFGRQSTIIRNSYTNNSRNPIIELSYGGDVNSASTKITRYVFQVDLSTLLTKISNNEIFESNITKHTLKIKNCISLSDEYIGINFITNKRASGFDLKLIQLDEDFDEGTGYDFIYSDSQYREIDLNKSAANWFYRKNPQITWGNNGIFTGTTDNLPISAIVGTQRFELGNEDIEIDVTDYVNGILYSSNTNNGLCITYSPDTETLASTYKHVVTFFSKYTQTFFEPFLETEYENRISDDRCMFYFDQINTLYFLPNVLIDSIDSLEIIDQNDNILSSFTSTTSFTRIDKFNYSININIPSTGYNDIEQFKDVWTYTLNGIQKRYENTFNIKQFEITDENNTYSTQVFININGIKQNEIISKKVGKKRINFKPKRITDSFLHTNILGDIEFRIFVTQGKNQIEIIPFTKANKIKNQYFSDIDFSWFIPHDYFIEARSVNKDGIQYPSSNTTRFRITN